MKENDLYKVDILAFNSQIGYITNLGTTFYAMQAQYPKGSPEYEELDKRLKLCCTSQSAVIDSAKGIKVRPLPKHWTNYQKILETDTEEEKARKNFENKLVIEKRPEFMKHLYPHYGRKYKQFREDFNLYSQTKFGCDIKDLNKNDQEQKQTLEYYNQKNPLLESDSVMNKVCRYMEKSIKEIKVNKAKPNNQKIFEKLYNTTIVLDNDNLEKMKVVKQEYDNFKKTKQLKSSEFTTYEQYYKFLRNKCLQEISSNIQELANLAIYICYFLNPTKPKDFCWDVFGGGIVENLKENHPTARIPKPSLTGDVEYLGERYEFVDFDYNATDTFDSESLSDNDFEAFEDIDDFEDGEEDVDF
nr:MAG TPA: hypothetical protein [Caudoviricetes sp.]